MTLKYAIMRELDNSWTRGDFHLEMGGQITRKRGCAQSKCAHSTIDYYKYKQANEQNDTRHCFFKILPDRILKCRYRSLLSRLLNHVA